MSPASDRRPALGKLPDPKGVHLAEAALKGPAIQGITVGNWTLQWDGEVWTVGRPRIRIRRGARVHEWLDQTWHGGLDQALRKLLSRTCEGETSEIEELAQRVESASLAICEAVNGLVDKG